MRRPQENSPFKDSACRSLGPTIRIMQINIEGISRAKCEYLSRISLESNIDLIAIQETHAANEDQLRSRGKIPGYVILGATFHHTYGIATYVRKGLENASLCATSTNNDIHSVVIKMGDVTVTNVYKPPSDQWPPYVLQPYPHPAIYLGDFNSHHVQWKYAASDPNGEALVLWAEEHKLHLIFDAKDKNTFRSAAWRREYNPDLCFVSSNNHVPLATSRRVIADFPHSQHRLILVEIGIKVPILSCTPQPRWNFNKANWLNFAEQLDKCLGWIPPTSDNYERFKGAVKSSAKKSIPRGYRKEYIPGWSRTSEDLYEEFCTTGDQTTANDLIHSLDAARHQKWIETVESLDFKRSSRKAWSLLRKLGGGSQTTPDNSSINPNTVASHIIASSKAPKDRDHTIKVKRDLKILNKTCPEDSNLSQPFTPQEITEALKNIKPGKAPGFDGIHPEFLLHMGKYAKLWLAKFYSHILQTGVIPQLMKRTKIIAILKPGKPNDQAKSYRPIALLSTTYKLLERLLYNRISTTILENVPVEQAGFRPNRSCTDQVLSLTTYIEAGYQKQLKTSVAFVDLTAAYDTVWRQGIICKLLQVIPCKRIARLIDCMLTNRKFRVIMGSKTSNEKTLNNGLPQGSVLAPLLFNLYIADLPATSSRKFGYADDWALAIQSKSMESTEESLRDDLITLGQFFRKWRLQLNPNKTEVTCFHLNNKMAHRELNVQFGNTRLAHNKYPKYLGVTLDRTLSYKEHLKKTSAKLQSRNNILQKLCGTTWGSSASTLRSSALGLAFPVAEYCSPVWLNSSHIRLVDSQLNQTMRTISGTIRSTPTFWLPALCNIHPPHLRRENALVREYKKILSNDHLPIHTDIPSAINNRLRSRNPPIRTAMNLLQEDFDPSKAWIKEWTSAASLETQSISCLVDNPSGFDLPRKTWSTLNRIRTHHGRCADFLHKWGKLSSPECTCGALKQTVRHMVEECPLTAYLGNPGDFMHATPSCITYIENQPLNL